MSHRALDDIVDLHRRLDDLDVTIAAALKATASSPIVELPAYAALAELKAERRRLALRLSVIEDGQR